MAMLERKESNTQKKQHKKAGRKSTVYLAHLPSDEMYRKSSEIKGGNSNANRCFC